jgi:ubiquinone/menaquinone biosynthesis C-methylase UbiE
MMSEDYYNKTKAYYNRIGNLCGVYSNYPFLIEGFKFNSDLTVHFNKIIEIAEISSGLNILEAGCGYGEVLKNLSKLKPDNSFTGITLVESHLHKKRFDNIFVENFDNMSFNSNSFDRVLCIESFSHSYNKYKTFLEIKRVLKPHGLCFILDLSVTTDFIKSCIFNIEKRKNYIAHINFFGDKPIDFKSMIKKAQKAGLKFLQGNEKAENKCVIKNKILNNAIEPIILTKKLSTFYNYYLFSK